MKNTHRLAPLAPLAPLALIAALCAGCAAPPPQPHANEYKGEPTNEIRTRFSCNDGDEVEMRFFNLQGVGVLVRHGETIELQQEPAASGFKYSNGPTTVRGKGDALTLEIGRMMPIECQALSK